MQIHTINKSKTTQTYNENNTRTIQTHKKTIRKQNKPIQIIKKRCKPITKTIRKAIQTNTKH